MTSASPSGSSSAPTAGWMDAIGSRPTGLQLSPRSSSGTSARSLLRAAPRRKSISPTSGANGNLQHQSLQARGETVWGGHLVTSEERRALALLANDPNGVTEAMLAAHGFAVSMLAPPGGRSACHRETRDRRPNDGRCAREDYECGAGCAEGVMGGHARRRWSIPWGGNAM